MRLGMDRVGTLASPLKRKTSFPKRCVGRNGKTEGGKHNRTSGNSKTENGRNGRDSHPEVGTEMLVMGVVAEGSELLQVLL